ncbi:GntR family transcriptional regulator [Lacticaseibacillus daqingensis]|uniref:GntR family transcriptional regulator n=1 Tax=Lacticaseibacillus daqingensis TaxID=2486014 RepID=UPI000F78B599|nr:GntR family transcriptional regulator [Lacticaseibacillus daqingensis]
MVKYVGENGTESLSDQLVDQLKKWINTQMQVGDMLPTERDLSVQYGVSRTTVRIALQKLEQIGYVNRQQGRGTFISSRKDSPASEYVEDQFRALIEQSGRHARTRVLGVEYPDATAQMAKLLELNEGTKLLEIRLLRIADTLPVIYERVYLGYERYQEILPYEFEHKSPQRILIDEFGARALHMDDVIQVVPASAEVLENLEIGSPVSVMQTQRVIYTSNNEPLAVVLDDARAEEFVYHASRRVE